MAAKTNSSWAPLGPRSRSRPSLRMRLRCANRISIFLRSRRDCSNPSVPANDRATSRAKVAPREGAIIPLRLIEHRDMWRDALLLDQPVQHRSCPVSGIADKPLRLEAEVLFGPFDHGLRSADLGLPNRAGGAAVAVAFFA